MLIFANMLNLIGVLKEKKKLLLWNTTFMQKNHSELQSRTHLNTFSSSDHRVTESTVKLL